jgi:hypothetical protein
LEWGVKGLNPNDKIEDLYIESPPFSKAGRRIELIWT